MWTYTPLRASLDLRRDLFLYPRIGSRKKRLFSVAPLRLISSRSFSLHTTLMSTQGASLFLPRSFFDYFGGPKLGQGGPKPMPARSLWSLSTHSQAWLWYTSGARCSHPPQGRHGVTTGVDDLVRCTVGSEQSVMWPILLGNPGEAYSAKKEWRRSLTRLRSKGCRSPRPARGSAFVALRYECR